MSKLGLLTFAELSALAGIIALYLLKFIDFDTLLTVGMVVIAAFLIPSLIAIRAERVTAEVKHG